MNNNLLLQFQKLFGYLGDAIFDHKKFDRENRHANSNISIMCPSHDLTKKK